MKKLAAVVACVATVLGTSILGAPAALAAPGDGTITITVVTDVDLDGARSAVDTPMSGVTVRITDSSGHVVTRSTNASGQVVVAAADGGNTLVGGQYRIDVTNPSTTNFTDAYILDGHVHPQFAPTTSFVDVSEGDAADVAVGYVDRRTLGAENAMIYSAVQPDSIWPGTETTEIYRVPYRLDTAISDVTPRLTVGSVYGIGIDQQEQMVYAGAYAKRGSAYGPGGPGAIYRVNPFTGASEVYVTVADAGTTAHDMTETNGAGHALQDYSFRTAVGRESLGDVEVTDDGRFLLAINMNTDSVVVFPVQDSADPAPLQTLPIPVVGTCASDWAPMAIDEHEGFIYLGATCGATSEASVIQYSLSAAGILAPTGVVYSGDPTTAPGHSGVSSGNIPTAAECEDVDWMPWRDDVPQPCIDNSAATSPPDPAGQGLARQFSVPQPMLSDIEFTETGGMILGFRDRGGDQYSSMLYYGERTTGVPAYSNYIATGDIVAVCVVGVTLDFDCRGAQPRGGDFDDYGGFHNEAAFGGMVHVPGIERIVINQMDATELWSNGLRAFNPATGNQAAGATGTANRLVTNDFQKAQGLADMEALVRETMQQIGNRIWLDTDEDGIQDPDEPIAAGVQVSLYDAAGDLVATTETDANGEYWFDTSDGLLPSTQYQIRLDRETDFEPGGPLAEVTLTGTAVGSNRNIDSNGSIEAIDGVPTVVANVTTPADYVNDHSIDFGFVPTPVSIGDYVWLDLDDDGQQDAGEDPVAGITVRLLDALGAEVATTITDVNGYYAFTDLRASTDYTVVFPTTVTVAGAVYRLTEPERGAGASDSNPAVDTGEAPVRTPATGANSGEPDEADDPTIDAGYVPIVSVGDYLWIDSDEDGIQDPGESPVPAGTEVRLLSADGTTEIATTTTDADGYYVFTDLPGDTEFVIEFPTSVTVGGIEHSLTTPNAGGSDADDSDADPSDGRVSVTTPASGQNLATPGDADDPTIDAGYTPNVVSIGDYVWIDADRDGIQDAGEDPVPGATVNLLSADGSTVIATTTTDADGFYFFANLPVDTEFVVEFPTTVTVGGITHSLTAPGQGTEPADDSNPAPATGRATVTTPSDGDNLTEPGQTDDPTIDAGYITPLVSIGDYVWIDADRDGTQDAGEDPVPGATVELRSADGSTLITTTTTDADGYYVFSDLPPGTDYQVVFPTTVTIDGVRYELTEQGGGGASDSNPAVSTGVATVTTPLSGSNSTEPGEADDPTIDAGFVPTLVSIGDYVWIDADRDGVQDATESPVPGAPVRLLSADGTTEIATTVTDANGYYAFVDLINSTDYIVEFPTTVTVGGVVHTLTEQGAGADGTADSNPVVATGRAPVTTPATGGNSGEPDEADDPTIDAGYVAPQVSIGDYVWIDTDRDGVQDADEAPIPGVTVQLLSPDGSTVIATTTTDADGYYVFPDLPTSTPYLVEFPTSVTIDGVEIFLTNPNAGADAEDSDADPTTGRVAVTTPASGSNSTVPGEADDPTIDAGYLPTLVSAGDYVWIDVDHDGVQDPDEPSLPGITVNLYDADGDLVDTTTTDGDGYYVFTDLPAGTEYTIEFPVTVTVDGVPHHLTQPNRGGDDGADSDVDPTTGRVTFTTALSGSNSAVPGEADGPDIDAGFTPAVVPVPGLASSGAQVPWTMLGAAFAILLLGGALVWRRRREV